MRFQRILIGCSVCLATVFSTQAIAQSTNTASEKKKEEKKATKKLLAPDEMTYAVGITAGTQGVGADFTLRINHHFNVRLGLSVLPNASYTMKDVKMGQINTDVNIASRNFSNFHTYFDYFPFKSSGFHLTVGYALTAESTGDATVTPKGTYSYNDYPLTLDQIGEGYGNITWESGISPYFGGGFLFGANKNKKFHVSLDLGTYYLPKPYASISGTKLLSQNSQNSAQFQENMSEYRWWPVLQLGLSYKL
jgi:hypothetical protein